MKCYLKKVNSTNQEAFFRLHGDDLWELMCSLEIDKVYTYKEAAKLLWPKAQYYICKTEEQLVRNIMLVSRNMRAEYKNIHRIKGYNLEPDDICPIKYVTNGFSL